MAFRANESANQGFERVCNYLISKDFCPNERREARIFLEDFSLEHGPVINHYPSWHPLVTGHDQGDFPISSPSGHCGYEGLDHSVFFASAFITCPYGDGQGVLDSVAKLPPNPAAYISAERLDVALYNKDACPIVVRCEWKKPLRDGLIPKSVAVPLLLEQELPFWRRSEVAETWQTMKPYFLGSPHGSRSSLFVAQETGQVMKEIWNALINTGMYGPIMVDG